MRLTPMYRAHVVRRARFADTAGWRVPDCYSSPEEETRGARVGLGLADMSAGGHFRARGEEVEAWWAKLTDAPVPAAGSCVQIRIEERPVLACRMAPDEVFVLTAPADAATIIVRLAATASVGCAHVTDVTGGFAVMDLVGPALPTLLSRLAPIDLAGLRPLALAHGEFAQVRALMIQLASPALPALRLLVAREYGEFVWETAIDAGRDLGALPIGGAARAMLLPES